MFVPCHMRCQIFGSCPMSAISSLSPATVNSLTSVLAHNYWLLLVLFKYRSQSHQCCSAHKAYVVNLFLIVSVFIHPHTHSTEAATSETVLRAYLLIHSLAASSRNHSASFSNSWPIYVPGYPYFNVRRFPLTLLIYVKTIGVYGLCQDYQWLSSYPRSNQGFPLIHGQDIG